MRFVTCLFIGYQPLIALFFSKVSFLLLQWVQWVWSSCEEAFMESLMWGGFFLEFLKWGGFLKEFFTWGGFYRVPHMRLLWSSSCGGFYGVHVRRLLWSSSCEEAFSWSCVWASFLCSSSFEEAFLWSSSSEEAFPRKIGCHIPGTPIVCEFLILTPQKNRDPFRDRCDTPPDLPRYKTKIHHPPLQKIRDGVQHPPPTRTLVWRQLENILLCEWAPSDSHSIVARV